MARPPIPPRGYYIPTHMLFSSQMPRAVCLTWLQLRSLTWRGTNLPALDLEKWVDLTGISKSTFTRHLNCLQKLDILHWQSVEPGMVCITFNDLPPSGSMPAKKTQNSKIGRVNSPKMTKSKMENPPSLNPPLVMDSVQNLLKDSKINLIPQDQEVKRGCEGERECEGERVAPTFQNCENQATQQPDQVYRSLTPLRLNQTQQSILVNKITDGQLWQATLEHWLGHGWNPRNLAGMLDLYSRGGPAACRSCKPIQRHHQVKQTAQDYSQDALESLRRELSAAGSIEQS